MTQDTRSQLCTSAAAFAENNFLFHSEKRSFRDRFHSFSHRRIPHSPRVGKSVKPMELCVLFIITIKMRGCEKENRCRSPNDGLKWNFDPAKLYLRKCENCEIFYRELWQSKKELGKDNKIVNPFYAQCAWYISRARTYDFLVRSKWPQSHEKPCQNTGQKEIVYKVLTEPTI